VRAKLAGSRAWAERALVAIANNGGFAPYDEILLDFSEELESGRRRHLTPRQLAVAQKELSRRYADRVLRLIRRRQAAACKAPLVRVEARPPWSAKAATVVEASGARIEEYRDGMAFAEAVIAAQGEDLMEIGWSAREVYDLRDELAAVAWGWVAGRDGGE